MASLYVAVVLWVLASSALSVLMAPFRKRTSHSAAIFGIDDMLLIGGGAALLNALKGKKKKDALKDQTAKNNAYTAARDASNKDIAAKLTAAGFDPFGPQVSTNDMTGSSSSSSGSRTNSVTNQRGTSSSQFANKTDVQAEYAPMVAKLKSLIGNELTDQQVKDAEIAANLQRINAGSRAAEADVANKVARMNLGGSSLQATMLSNPIARDRNAQITAYLSSIPREEMARRDRSYGNAMNLVRSFGTGQSGQQSGVQDSVSNTNSNTSGWGNSTSSSMGRTTAPPNVGVLQSLFNPSAPMESTKTGYSPWLDAASGGIDAVGTYLAGRKTGVTGIPFTPNNGNNFLPAGWSLPPLRG